MRERQAHALLWNVHDGDIAAGGIVGAAERRARAKVLAISRADQLAPVDEALASMFVIDAQPPSDAAIPLIPEAVAARRVMVWAARRHPRISSRPHPAPGAHPSVVLYADLSRWRPRRLG